jgi:hypothetical protein
LSEEFGGALPSVILEELGRMPAGFLEQVIEYRSFAAVYLAVKSADSSDARDALMMSDRMARLAGVIEFEIAQDAKDDDTWR